MDPDFQNNQPGQMQQPGFQPNPPAQPNIPAPTQPDTQNSYGDLGSGGSDNKTKKLLVVIAALAGLFIIIVIIVLAFSEGETPDQQPQTEATGDFYVKEPSAVDVESVNNSISNNISGLDTDADFPEDKLNDLNLGL